MVASDGSGGRLIARLRGAKHSASPIRPSRTRSPARGTALAGVRAVTVPAYPLTRARIVASWPKKLTSTTSASTPPTAPAGTHLELLADGSPAITGPDSTRPRTGTVPSTQLAISVPSAPVDEVAGQQRRVAEEPRDPLVGGGEVDLARGVYLEEPAVGHDCNLVGQRERLALVVGDEYAGGAAGLQRPDHRAAGLLAEPGVEGRERLVEEHQRRAWRQRAGQGDPLLLAAGELVRDSGRARSRGSSTSSSSSATRPPTPRRCSRGSPKAMLRATSRCGKSAPSWGT